jgi:hypothetical protein
MTTHTALTIEETATAVIIKKDGIEVDLGSDGNIVVHTNGDVKVQPTPANDTATPAATTGLQPGDKMPDGSIFAGISPDTGKQMFAMPADAGVSLTFNQAAKYAKTLNGKNRLGHDDWRVPTEAELHVLFENGDKGALKGTFNLTGSYPLGWYHSKSFTVSTTRTGSASATARSLSTTGASLQPFVVSGSARN